MRDKINGLFSISEKESQYFNDKEGFIELGSYPSETEICIEHLDLINKKMHNSRSYWLNKDFPQAIEALKMAH